MKQFIALITVFAWLNLGWESKGQIVIGSNGASGPITATNLTMATDRLLGRDTASTGAIEELSVGTGLSITSATLTLDADLVQLAGQSGTNTIYYRSASNTWSAVTVGTGLSFAGGILSASGSGDVVGPASSVANDLPIFDGTTGKLLKATSTSARISINNDGNTASNYFDVFDGDNGITRMRVGADGRVIIGSTTPDATSRLALQADTGNDAASLLTIREDGGTETAHIQGDGKIITTNIVETSGAWPNVHMKPTSGGFSGYLVDYNGANKYQMFWNQAAGINVFDTIAGNLEIKYNNSTKLTIHTGGVNVTTLRITAPVVPANAADTGSAGQVAWDADYIYICTATNTWKRVAIATW